MKSTESHILIVDDNQTTLTLYRKIFKAPSIQTRASRYTFHDATSGDEAVKLAKQLYQEGKTLDLAILDIRMPPGMNGIEAAKQLKAIDPTLIIVLASAFSDFSLEEITAQMGGPNDLLVIQKPFHEKEIKQLVYLLTRRSQERREHISFFRKLVQSKLEASKGWSGVDQIKAEVTNLLDLVNDFTGAKSSGICTHDAEGGESILIGMDPAQDNRRQIKISQLKGEICFFQVQPFSESDSDFQLILQEPQQSDFICQGVAQELIALIPHFQACQKWSLTQSKQQAEPGLQEFHGIFTSDELMQNLFKRIQRVAGCGAPIFINGETGTGKELVARSLHDSGQRGKQPFVSINCANFTNELLESQLFGHKKGSFTGANQDQQGLFAAAEQGTLFLDEITEIPIQLQAKLLRVLQEKEYTPIGDTKAHPFDVQLISASQYTLSESVFAGKFRQDLQYRLQVIPLTLPALRERGQDAMKLFHHFLKEGYQTKRPAENLPDLSDEVHLILAEYTWPGNVRELLNLVQYIVIMQENAMIDLHDLPTDFALHVSQKFGEQQQQHLKSQLSSVDNNLVIEEVLKKDMIKALQKAGGNRTKAAQELGISRMTLWRKMKRWDL